MLTLNDALAIRWRAIVSDAIYNPDAGFEQAWALPENTWWGAPLTQAEDTIQLDNQQYPVRVFANAVVAWTPDGPKVLNP
jgi:hypothetical protein